MQIGFERFDKDWILPVEGTLGNKAQNLFANREAIAAAGFRRPEAVVVPWEYLRQAFKPEQFVLSIINEWLACPELKARGGKLNSSFIREKCMQHKSRQ